MALHIFAFKSPWKLRVLLKIHYYPALNYVTHVLSAATLLANCTGMAAHRHSVIRSLAMATTQQIASEL